MCNSHICVTVFWDVVSGATTEDVNFTQKALDQDVGRQEEWET